MKLTEDELRAVLRAEAAAHTPDRVAILSRVTETAMRTEAARGRGPRIRIAGAAVAVAAVVGGGGFAQWALAGMGDERPTLPPPPAVTASVAPAVTETAEPAPAPSLSLSPSRPSSSRRPTRSKTPSAPPAGALWSDGSVDVGGKTQASSVVTIKTTERLTALTVTIRLVRTDRLAGRGGSQQVPGASVNSAVIEEADALVYRFTLSSGDTLEPGTYTFFARYTYAEGGRDAGADTYAATATSANGAALNAGGAFG
ncbi:hypothetical protein GCM10010168_91410 [Actinoplanes ianthinogenes]|uniref:Ig-like domain-containing protein n=1 Tax=Actinoplanes ianthinogenes TaxID=122358 RepID=A0ABM7LWU9_9ACTN|nr:hypothetical protein [Actinoplanes ianthinogenes]BCJ43816.1 hypothetical protein Aiant_44730 [Actinoplanes ianthinogenes]GGR58273.1 hypothetical protein GCM10010168_91410 [Actinoplanes ianthinogenes]